MGRGISHRAIEAHFGQLFGFSKEINYGTRTYNARSETVATLDSFKNAWTKGRHCIVPADAIYEPDWRMGETLCLSAPIRPSLRRSTAQ